MAKKKKSGRGVTSQQGRKTTESVQNGNEHHETHSFKVQKNATLGRHLVATKVIKPGEVVLKDDPIVVGPCQETKPMCIGCYVNINLKDSKTYQRCPNCTWPLCSAKCPGRDKRTGHSRRECEFLSKSLIKDKQVSEFADYYYALTPFRCLLLKQFDSALWDVVKTMEAHSDERQKDVNLWETNRKMAIGKIQNDWGMTQFTEEDIHFVCGVLEVNAFEVNVGSSMTQCLRAIYPKAFLFAHDCVSNTCHSNGSEWDMVFRSTTAIAKGDIITVSYAYTLQSTLMRRRHLRKTKFFLCTCKRCQDPTELGTHAGTMKCQKCKEGLLLPNNPLDMDSVWKCNLSTCKFEYPSSQIVFILNRLFEELDKIDGNDVVGYEIFLNKCAAILHEGHYLRLSALHCLSQLYGKIDGYLINDLTDQQLQRKIDICKRLIKVFEKLEPGLSKQRGILLYEVHAPLMVLTQRECQSQNIPSKEIRRKIKEVLKYLEEAHLILSRAPEGSDERTLAQVAQDAIASLKD